MFSGSGQSQKAIQAENQQLKIRIAELEALAAKLSMINITK